MFMRFLAGLYFIFSTVTFAMEASTETRAESSFSIESEVVNSNCFKWTKNITLNRSKTINLLGGVAIGTGIIALVYYGAAESSMPGIKIEEVRNLCREIWFYIRDNFRFDQIGNIDLSCPDLLNFFNKTDVNLYELREHCLYNTDCKQIFIVDGNKYDALYRKNILYLHKYVNATMPINVIDKRQSIYWFGCASNLFGATVLACNNIKHCAKKIIENVRCCTEKDPDNFSEDEDL